MRVLIGHTNQMPELLFHRPLPGRAARHDDILAFGNGYRQVAYTPGMTWNELLARCPSGWEPEVYLHWSLEYNAIPAGLEEARCLTAATVGDWNLGGQAVRHIGGAFDVLFADRNGTEFLRRLGFANVQYAPLWAYDPGQHRRLQHTQRDIDVLMVGNFNHAVQRERAQWLARVARLSRKHRVVLTCGVFGEEYVRLMNRAKIVFNRSIRGEINMRAYEAAACGALMFYERENTEIRSLFTDREHCVLYGEEDLEALLDYYLTHNDEREQIADAGRWRVHPHEYARHLAGMLDTLEPIAAAKKAQEGENAPRLFCLASPQEKRFRLASQWLCSTDRTIYPKLDALLTTAAEEATGTAERAEIANLRAALLGEWAHTVSSPPEQREKVQAALAHAQRALEWEPDYLAARYNLGFLRFSAGQADEAERTLCEVAESLAAPDVRPSQLRGVYFPRRFDYFDVEIERLWGESAPDTPAWREGIRSLLRWCIHATLTATAFARGEYETALFHAEQAVAQRPTLGETLHSMALALRALGRWEEAANACRRAVADAPFLLPAWEDLVRIYLDLRRPEEALTVLEEVAVLLDGCPVYASARPGFESLRAQAQAQLRQQQANAPQVSPFRFLAFPAWSEATQWQALVRAFAAQYGPEDPAVLLLRADPVAHPSAEALLERLAAFLIQEMGLPEEALPNITLLNEPLQEGELGRLFGAADAVLTQDGAELTALHRELARTAGLPIWTLDEMASRKAA